ncbi:N-alpha-acetyltransferase 38, NatC auxiliary subunit [Haemorhous mexicanus]|uniref:N-alpha-acetyltransferase 38, NatC auxiliary subunit n=1 Tax=Haemorhous mexicanus TaxID=30427 RepID=UPI0028BD3A71|nr:N-alpha-acetyltransferase 38, NatC auxiliary subunit [Haemorhous mexicanus]
MAGDPPRTSGPLRPGPGPPPSPRRPSPWQRRRKSRPCVPRSVLGISRLCRRYRCRPARGARRELQSVTPPPGPRQGCREAAPSWRIRRRSRGAARPPGRGSRGPPRGRQRLEALLNRSLRIRMSDGRTLVGAFLCTDRQSNVILGSAQEFLKAADAFPGSEPRVLGLAMVPGHHIVSIEVEPPYP